MNECGQISILMASYNGEEFIEKQLDSILKQSYQNWVLYISDDGSTDTTLSIIEKFSTKLPSGKVILLRGPGKGFAENFLSMLRNKNIKSSYYAFADQDDIWLEDKLMTAVNTLANVSESYTYLLYGSRTTLVDANEQVIGLSPLFKKSIGFRNALLQSYAGGNTMVFNHHLKSIFENMPDDLKIVSHDWILYILCSALNGHVVYDEVPKILYRQHHNNLVGSNQGVMSKLNRLKKLFQGEFKVWALVNEKALNSIFESMSSENKKILVNFYKDGRRGLVYRLSGFLNAKVYRQSSLETAVFMIMTIFKKLV